CLTSDSLVSNTLVRSRCAAIQVGARGGELGAASGGVLAGHDLINPHRAVAERERDSGQIGQPQPIAFGTDQRQGLVASGRQTLAPEPGRLRVMLAPVLYVVDLESAGFQRFARVADVIQFPAGKDVP